MKTVDYSHKRVIIKAPDGMYVEITPICVHRDKTPFQETCYKCNKRKEVVHCSGQVVSCEHYNPGQLSLF